MGATISAIVIFLLFMHLGRNTHPYHPEKPLLYQCHGSPLLVKFSIFLSNFEDHS
ncbi:unnamed protein product [Sphenostylis stenocarpa]|uniref:Uncharacterized protein n=1 Tax=Sphenostylis stenocarpa TaxID=92480 RepID=A0AA86SAQ8_9FABA|nr:unnamed protein product [Sphenostylis stenocarpa]